MMSQNLGLLKEVDIEAIAQSFSAQDVAVENSTKQKEEEFKEYEELLKKYKDKRRKYLDRREKHANLISKLTETLTILKSFEQLQVISNEKLVAGHQELIKMRQEVTRDSDNFVSSVNAIVAKIQNLSAEFDESSIREKISVCNKEIGILKQRHAYLLNMYETLQANLKLSLNVETTVTDGTLKTLGKIAENSRKVLPGIMFQNEAKVSLIRQNIEFLTQKINELKVQCSVLESPLVNN